MLEEKRFEFSMSLVGQFLGEVMSAANPPQMLAMLDALVPPWNDAVADTAKAHEQVLVRLLQIYGRPITARG